MLCKAVFSPKFSYWCEFRAHSAADNEALVFPTVVSLQFAPARVCPDIRAPRFWTSDELALEIASAGENWSAALMDYSLPDEPHLLSMVVSGVRERLPTQKPQRSKTNIALSDARALHQQDRSAKSGGASKGRGRGRSRGRGASAPAGRGGQPDLPTQATGGRAAAPRSRLEDAVATSGSGEVDAGVDDGGADADELLALGFDAEDLVEIVHGVSAHADGDDDGDASAGESLTGDALGHAAGDLDGGGRGVARAADPGAVALAEGPGDAPAAGAADAHEAVEAPPPAPEVIRVRGPCRQGYLYNRQTNAQIGRITAGFGTSVGVNCRLHTKCSLAIAEWKLPPLAELRQWIAERMPADADRDAKKAAADRHRDALRALIAQAVRPGRTRQHLIDEAAALDGDAA